MTKLFLILFLLIAAPLTMAAQNLIITNDGRELEGIIVLDTLDSITLKTLDGNTQAISKSSIEENYSCTTTIVEVVKTSAKKSKTKEYVGTLKDVSDTSYAILKKGILYNISKANVKKIEIVPENGRRSYPMGGLTLLMPGGLNIVAGMHFKIPLGFRVEAGYIGSVYGYQANLLYNFSKSRIFEHNISLGAGYFFMDEIDNINFEYSPEKSWTYYGLFYDINIGGFFAELGVSLGNGNFPNPQLHLQLGYVFRFNK